MTKFLIGFYLGAISWEVIREVYDVRMYGNNARTIN